MARASAYPLSRHKHASGNWKNIHSFSLNTGTTTLCWHLVSEHIGDWVISCDKLGIEITAETVAKEVANFRGESEQPEYGTNKKPERRNYSREAFVDAILAWVVADDQVRSHLFWIVCSHLFLKISVNQCNRVSRATTDIFNASQGAERLWYSSSQHTSEPDCRGCWRAFWATWKRDERKFSKQIFTTDQSHIFKIGRPHSDWFHALRTSGQTLIIYHTWWSQATGYKGSWCRCQMAQSWP